MSNTKTQNTGFAGMTEDQLVDNLVEFGGMKRSEVRALIDMAAGRRTFDGAKHTHRLNEKLTQAGFASRVTTALKHTIRYTICKDEYETLENEKAEALAAIEAEKEAKREAREARKAEKEAAQAELERRRAAGEKIRGRRRGGGNRSEDEINLERCMKSAAVETREALKMTSRGRIPADRQDEYDVAFYGTHLPANMEYFEVAQSQLDDETKKLLRKHKGKNTTTAKKKSSPKKTTATPTPKTTEPKVEDDVPATNETVSETAEVDDNTEIDIEAHETTEDVPFSDDNADIDAVVGDAVAEAQAMDDMG